ncbi:MAG: hypothetical protein Ct9H300mP13_4510 [Gammaproteobacteria bacterium]|nr:MAG: hypothetical protein Ct9H300mP13_4510 [Gammaproteobacteria bacterium]
MINLKGKVAIVTGGASGIGRACVLRMVEAGATVHFGDIDEVGGLRQCLWGRLVRPPFTRLM